MVNWEASTFSFSGAVGLQKLSIICSFAKARSQQWKTSSCLFIAVVMALIMSSHLDGFVFARVELRCESKSKQALSHQNEGACGEHDTPIALSTQLASRCHGVRRMMEHSHSGFREC